MRCEEAGIAALEKFGRSLAIGFETVIQADSFSFDQERGEILAQLGPEDKPITVRQLKHLRWLHFEGEAIQSLVDLRAPFFPRLAYAQCMSLVFCFIDRCERVLSLGMGGATVERFASFLKPDCYIDSVEQNKQVIELSEAYFGVPETCSIHCTSAEQYLDQCDERYDIILCDLFDHQGLASCIENEAYFRQCALKSKSHTVLVINLIPNSDQHLLDILLALRKSWSHVVAIETPGHRNIILFCGQSELEARERVLSKLEAHGKQLGFEAEAWGPLLNYLPPRTRID